MQINPVITGVFASLLLISQTHVFAAECTTESGATTVPLLELYTSEGCSSCPPAEKWLSSLKPDATKFVPLAFHVDYWDYIGWKDPFAKAEYSDRQRKTAVFAGAGFVYTPQFVLSGRDFKSANKSRLSQAIAASHKLPSRANLGLHFITQDNGEMTLKASVQAVKAVDIKNASIFIAIYENQLASQVNAGENSGRKLTHNYVVRDLFGAYQLSQNNTFTKEFSLKPRWKEHNAGAVIFVQNSQNGEILQSLQLPFCN